MKNALYRDAMIGAIRCFRSNNWPMNLLFTITMSLRFPINLTTLKGLLSTWIINLGPICWPAH